MSTPLGSSQWMYKTGEEPIAQSLKFNDDESQYLSWTPASAGNRKTWTWSGWVKRGSFTGSTEVILSAGDTAGIGPRNNISFLSDGRFRFEFNPSGSTWYSTITSAKYRDPSAWYHIVIAMDTTQATAADRTKLYVNGVQVTNFDSASYLPQNTDGTVNSTYTHFMGQYCAGTSYYDGYLADVYFIDGTALDPTSFGESVDGYWKPKEATGLTYGTNGFHLTFQDDIVSEGFNTVTYVANNGTQSVSGLGFSPDLVWLKNRDVGQGHYIADSVRGNDVYLDSQSTGADVTQTNWIDFDADGFSLNNIFGNYLTYKYVGWCWDAGTGSAASNTDGDITSTVKANPSYGFSVVSYVGTGATGTVGHSLSSAPELVIVKNRSVADSWYVYTTAIDGSHDYLVLNSTAAAGSSSLAAPTSSVFSTSAGLSPSGNNMVAYAWHSVAGYSKISSYSGTGATGNAVTGLGFKPAFLMIKRTDGVENWVIYDNTRSPAYYDDTLVPNSSAAENTVGADVTFDSDGFTLDNNFAITNASGGTYIYMAFADTREYAFWKDVSGNGNHWTPNNLDYRDSLPDTPTNNFATFNPIDRNTYGATPTYSEGNLKITYDGNAFTSMLLDSGKWFAEFRYSTINSVAVFVGLRSIKTAINTNGISVALYGSNASNYTDGVLDSSWGATWSAGDVISIAWDADNKQVSFYKNGTLQETAITYTNSELMCLYVAAGGASANNTVVLNTGQDSTFAGAMAMGSYTDDNGIGNFQYAPPSGYLSLCTSNLSTPTIVDGSQHFNTVLWTGDGTTDKSKIITVGFQSDFIWQKPRSSADSHSLVDSVRGFNWVMNSNGTSAEVDRPLRIADVDATSFAVADAASNASGVTNVGWAWKAGGTAVSNTDGSITSQVSANTDMGFSIVSYTGTGSAATVGHSLGVAPSMVIVKNRSAADGWLVWHEGLSSGTSYLLLHSTNAQASNSAYFNGSPTSSVFNIGTSTNTNGSGNNLIAYCFANSDIIKCGSYTGNGSSDGPFVYTGFRPAWVLIKRTDSTSSWWMMDNKRDTYNVNDAYLVADTSGAEGTYTSMDFLSNGFKPRNSSSSFNTSGATHIYLAIAETPLKYATAR